MQAVAALFVGRHDFASLASSGGSVKTTVRTVTRSEVRGDEDRAGTWIYEVEASGFLRKMVRSMMGAIVEAGRGSSTVESLAAALQARDRRAWPAPAAARGLTLVRVSYDAGASGPAVGRE
jgi:tRNA pseudouridine38-40 synthase